jgi:drug/metabolite transporter (DMT)-like permease
VFITLMLAIAVLCSWVGALCWNIASQRLPTVILGGTRPADRAARRRRRDSRPAKPEASPAPER